jgi:hypothetical protein
LIACERKKRRKKNRLERGFHGNRRDIEGMSKLDNNVFRYREE